MLFTELRSRYTFVSRWESQAIEALAYVNRHQCCIIQVFLERVLRGVDGLGSPSNALEVSSIVVSQSS